MSRAETHEPTEMLFGIWTPVGPRNHVLGEGLNPRRKGNWVGISCPIVEYREYKRVQGIFGVRSILPTLIGRWQQRCGLSLSVL